MKLTRHQSKIRRHRRVRGKVFGSQARPRLSVFRSNQHIYAQVIDDTQHLTMAAASTAETAVKSLELGATCAASTEVGKLIAARAIEKGISKVVFDRGGNLYHGRIKALAEAAREAGLDF